VVGAIGDLEIGVSNRKGEFIMIETANRSRQGSASQEVQDHSEGRMARAIEHHTAKLPSDAFLWAAMGTIGISLMLRMTGHKEESMFVGHWVSPMLILGLYNKVVKVAGSDRTSS
jgi:hypothetical protein